MHKENVFPTHSEILCSHKEKSYRGIYKEMDATRKPYVSNVNQTQKDKYHDLHYM